MSVHSDNPLAAIHNQHIIFVGDSAFHLELVVLEIPHMDLQVTEL
jgi:hypothetical protein